VSQSTDECTVAGYMEISPYKWAQRKKFLTNGRYIPHVSCTLM